MSWVDSGTVLTSLTPAALAPCGHWLEHPHRAHSVWGLESFIGHTRKGLWGWGLPGGMGAVEGSWFTVNCQSFAAPVSERQAEWVQGWGQLGRIPQCLGLCPWAGGWGSSMSRPPPVCSAILFLLQTGPEPLGRSPRPGWLCPVSTPGHPVGIPTLGSGQQNQWLKAPRRPPAAARSPRLAWPVLSVWGQQSPLTAPLEGPRATALQGQRSFTWTQRPTYCRARGGDG